jgi:phosphatidate cytidylyltransferase
MEDRDQPRAPEHDQDAEAPPAYRPGPGRARIAGVEAGVAAGLFPSTSAPDGPPTREPGSGTVPLPDWTDPPTREVPRVLIDPTATERTGSGPVWREIDADWEHDDLFADMVSEAHSRVDDDLDVDPWLAPPSRPAAGLIGRQQDVTTAFEPTAMVPARDREAGVPEAAFEDTKHGLGARVAWAGRAGRRRQADPEGAPSQPSDAPEAASESTSSGRSPVVATITGLAIGLLALLGFLLGPPATLTLVCLVLVVAMAECYQALRRAHYRPAALLGLIAAPGAAVAGYLKGPVALIFLAALVVGVTFLWFLLGVTRRNPVANIAATVMGWAWVGLLGGFAGLIISPSEFGHRTGVAYLLGALEATVAYDVGGYAIGSWFGRHKLAPAISPNKTWEGLLGGCAAAIVVALGITSQMHPWTLQRAAGLGLIVAVLAPLGDLAESLVKRDLHVKDMGSLLPAHGGMLDRIDALLFVLPATYYLVRLFHG